MTQKLSNNMTYKARNQIILLQITIASMIVTIIKINE